jgi:2-aminoadipate transaminase
MLVTERYFDGGLWRRSLDRLVETYRSRRDVMLGALAERFPTDARWTTPAGGFYVWVTLPEYFDTPNLLAAAVERKVAYVPGTAFYPDGRGRQQMRLSFCYPTEDRIEEGVRRLGELLADEEELFRSLSG